MKRVWLAALGLALAGGPAALAQMIVTSPGPDRVAVTVYRDPGRAVDEAFDLQWLEGFALISETRRVTIPAGESDIRFEGVAGGIVPQSAIVTGLPDTVERNRDAYLLSPGTLLDRSLGRRVHLRRTSHATGAVREHEAVIRSGADGAVVLETADGVEALRCTGLAETLIYDEVPAGLSARPTLSVRARSSAPVTATVTLSYLATGFDWQANYIATLSPDEDRIDLFAWLTLANGDETGFADADTQAVAGRLNYRDQRAPPSEARPLTLNCWPHSTTSDLPLEAFERMVPPAAPPMADGETVYVTGSRVYAPNLASSSPITVISAEQEELGDLKLYRIPEPVTVAAQSQKQVALLQRDDVTVELVYRQRLYARNVDLGQGALRRVLVSRNRTEEGLGLPLPAGPLMLFAEAGDRPILISETNVRDFAVGEEVEIELAPSLALRSELRRVSERDTRRRWELVVSNDSARPLWFEAEFNDFDGLRADGRLGRRDGRPLWRVLVPANGRVTLSFRDRIPR